MTRLFRRWVARAVISVSIVAATVGASYGQDKVVRIGFQKYGKLVLLKSKGSLEQKLKSVGYSVVWTEFPSGPPLLEALNVGAIDFGNTGEAPPIFAQAAGADAVLALLVLLDLLEAHAQRLTQRLTQHDRGVLDGVVPLDLDVTLRLDRQVEAAVLAEGVEHVIEERDAGRDVRHAGAVEIQRNADLRFRSIAGDLCNTHGGVNPAMKR
mgnify:CR=1 FL=1